MIQKKNKFILSLSHATGIDAKLPRTRTLKEGQKHIKTKHRDTAVEIYELLIRQHLPSHQGSYETAMETVQETRNGKRGFEQPRGLKRKSLDRQQKMQALRVTKDESYTPGD